MACWFQCWKNSTAIDVKMDGSVLEEQSFFKMLGLTFSSKLDCGSYVYLTVIARTVSKKIGALIHSLKFLSPVYKSTIRPCMEYCAPSCYLELLGKLQKQVWRVVGPSLFAAFFFKPLDDCQSVAILSLFYRYYFGSFSSQLDQRVSLAYFWI